MPRLILDFTTYTVLELCPLICRKISVLEKQAFSKSTVGKPNNLTVFGSKKRKGPK